MPASAAGHRHGGRGNLEWAPTCSWPATCSPTWLTQSPAPLRRARLRSRWCTRRHPRPRRHRRQHARVLEHPPVDEPRRSAAPHAEGRRLGQREPRGRCARAEAPASRASWTDLCAACAKGERLPPGDRHWHRRHVRQGGGPCGGHFMRGGRAGGDPHVCACSRGAAADRERRGVGPGGLGGAVALCRRGGSVPIAALPLAIAGCSAMPVHVDLASEGRAMSDEAIRCSCRSTARGSPSSGRRVPARPPVRAPRARAPVRL